jgi:hypothetical protein
VVMRCNNKKVRNILVAQKCESLAPLASVVKQIMYAIAQFQESVGGAEKLCALCGYLLMQSSYYVAYIYCVYRQQNDSTESACLSTRETVSRSLPRPLGENLGAPGSKWAQACSTL